MDLIEALNWRYATKRMNGKKVAAGKIEAILEATRLSASSLGLQPYTIFNIENPDTRKELQQAAFNQPQLTESSNVLVFAAWKEISEEMIDIYINDIATTRNMQHDQLKGFRDMALGFTANTPVSHFEWSSRQVYIALGTALVAAAEQKVDATPMEGFNNAEVDRILGLEEMGLSSVVLLPLGYRDENQDKLSKAKKVRRSREKLILDIV